ncbi:MAG: hypothetical protein WKI04_03275 [Ferruginibacter sp.]
MKKLSPYLFFLFSTSFMLQSCVKDRLQTTYTYFVPVYKSKTAVWQSIKSAPPQALKTTGKLFLYGQYIFINEVNKGVHIIDNVNPLAPKNIAFIAIPGNLDIAVKNNTLYADLYTDMVTLDIKDPANVVLKKVTNKVFPERDYNNGFVPDSLQYIVGWEKRETRNKNGLDSKLVVQDTFNNFSSAQDSRGAAAGVAGISGSMARFTIVNNYLYTAGRSFLTTFNITTNVNPVKEHVQTMGWNIETIYPLKDKLFIGAQTGMFIYSISDPASPAFLGSFSHACFNDPVIADDNYAYVTLRASTEASFCRGAIALQKNELDIVNISNILQPTLVKLYDMEEPQGLSKDGNLLFICDGKGGLKIYNAANVMDLKELKVINNIKPFDVICQNGLAIVVAEEGIYQYDYSNIDNIYQVSKMTIEKN